jgi:hypothetical protein
MDNPKMSKTGKPGGLFGMGKRDFLVSLHNALISLFSLKNAAA